MRCASPPRARALVGAARRPDRDRRDLLPGAGGDRRHDHAVLRLHLDARRHARRRRRSCSLTGLPISRYAARYGVDIDLLTRGAGFGYIGSTITSLIYATFTFILFAIEASIMSTALELCFGMPLWLGYVISAVAVIPLVTHGITWISRFQLWTQPLWIGLNILPVGFILCARLAVARRMDELSRPCTAATPSIDILKFGGAGLGDPRPDAADRRAGRRAALPAGRGPQDRAGWL